MEIFHTLEEVTTQHRPSVVTVGNFDGVHLAHQALLRRVLEIARAKNLAAVAVTFEPHPSRVLAPHNAPPLLTPLAVKQALIAATGIDLLLVLPFTRDFSLWSPQDFAQMVFIDALKASTVVVGDNFHFGHRQSGTPALLAEIGNRSGFAVIVLLRLFLRGRAVSSSEIRRLLDEGNISLADRLLGRPFSVRHSVHPGHGIGSKQTVPTLNLAPYSERLPAPGVYITWATIDSNDSNDSNDTPAGPRRFRSVTNVGYRPTFGGHDLGVETHLLDPWSGPPPEAMEVSFLYRLRPERKFDSPDQLKAQILRDIRRATNYFRRLKLFRVQ